MRIGLGFGLDFLPGRLGGAIAPGIRLAGARTLQENSAQNTAVGTLSVVGGTGTYTFTLTDSAGSRFKVAGTNGVNLQAGATASNAEVATSYNITVHADNGAGSTFDATYAIAIVDVNEFTPVITSNGGGASASVSIAENTTAVTTVTATDADVTASLVYSISGGADAAKFTIDSSSGVLAFATAPDYEIPTDADTNNQYVVIVQVSDGTNTDTQTITVTVTNVVEVGDPAAPTAPVLAMDPAWTTADSTPDFIIDIDDTIGSGDSVTLQIQASGGDWSVLLHDSTHSITAPEDIVNEISLSNGSLANGDYESRARVNDGVSDSAWSNTQTFTIAAVVSSPRIASAGNKRIASAGNYRIKAA